MLGIRVVVAFLVLVYALAYMLASRHLCYVLCSPKVVVSTDVLGSPKVAVSKDIARSPKAVASKDVVRPLKVDVSKHNEAVVTGKASEAGQSEAYAFMLYGGMSHKPALATAVYSIRELDQKRPILVVTSKATQELRQDMAKLNASVVERPHVNGPRWCKGSVGRGKARLINSFFKMHIWNLTQFRTVLYLEVDMFFRGPLTEIFSRFRELPRAELMIARMGTGGCPPPGSFKPSLAGGWNTGIFIFHPSPYFTQIYAEYLSSGRRFGCGGGSQPLENILFRTVLQNRSNTTKESRLACMPIIYNCKAHPCAKNAVVIHWSGERKPWDGAAGFTDFLEGWQKQRDKALRLLEPPR